MAGTAIVTAPAKTATDIPAAFAGERFCFMAPDALLASGARADWLVVDEAAAIPAPLLLQLVSRFPRILLTTTVQGYEGTGRGFISFAPVFRSFTASRFVSLSAGHQNARWKISSARR